MRFEITQTHVVDIPDEELDADRPLEEILEEIKDDAHWYVEMYACESWCEEVTSIGRQL
ncbi:hypothetical protein [Collinsella aerofaciens]|uniref:hypothetical protein n=1 Tax=Collinsella aerofaciens TaxID=74426 RepID=UPI00232D9C61|nr:hypothetical protein [Collinsella aerofaciens]MDB1907677.1 hypothetical protein [Collinsella aerofaciens]